MTEPAPNSDFLQQANNLETLFNHLKKTTQNLDEVIVDGQQQFEELKQRVERLAKVVQKKPIDPEVDLETTDS